MSQQLPGGPQEQIAPRAHPQAQATGSQHGLTILPPSSPHWTLLVHTASVTSHPINAFPLQEEFPPRDLNHRSLDQEELESAWRCPAPEAFL